MEVTIYETDKGKPVVSVRGSSKNTPEQIAKAYKKVKEELNKKEENNANMETGRSKGYRGIRSGKGSSPKI